MCSFCKLEIRNPFTWPHRRECFQSLKSKGLFWRQRLPPVLVYSWYLGLAYTDNRHGRCVSADWVKVVPSPLLSSGYLVPSPNFICICSIIPTLLNCDKGSVSLVRTIDSWTFKARTPHVKHRPGEEKEVNHQGDYWESAVKPALWFKVKNTDTAQM